MASRSKARLATWLTAAASLWLCACSTSSPRFPLRDPIWTDPDRRPFKGDPDELEYFSPFYWDGADQMVFRPIARFFAVDPAAESVNVNAVDEVPDSSWFTNRLGRRSLSAKQVAEGPCAGHAPIDPAGPWTVTGAKPNGANPGFLIKAQDGRRYLLKFDGTTQGARPTSADVIGSKIYWAAGYTTPCNSITFFDRKILRIAPDATTETPGGDKVRMVEKDLDPVFDKALRLGDGRYRASASLFLDGKPIGPFRYQDKRSDDPNDVIDHDDRRDLRGMYVLAAWTNHFDSREQNTLNTWHEVSPGMGYIRHNMIDFGDCFGSVWEPPMMGRRIGHSNYMDPGHIFEDLLTLGIIERPWESTEARFGVTGSVLGYYQVKRFVPDKYRPGYPNPAFSRVSERDAAWMTRIVAELKDEHLRAIIEQARIQDSRVSKELFRVIRGRRDKILRRWLGRLSPLAHPELHEGSLCVRDLAAETGAASKAGYWAKLYQDPGLKPTQAAAQADDASVCVRLPQAKPAQPAYVVVDLAREGMPPTRTHLYHLPSGHYRLVGLERPDSAAAPE